MKNSGGLTSFRVCLKIDLVATTRPKTHTQVNWALEVFNVLHIELAWS